MPEKGRTLVMRKKSKNRLCCALLPAHGAPHGCVHALAYCGNRVTTRALTISVISFPANTPTVGLSASARISRQKLASHSTHANIDHYDAIVVINQKTVSVERFATVTT